MNEELRKQHDGSSQAEAESTVAGTEPSAEHHNGQEGDGANSIGSVISTFVDHIDSLRSTLRVSMFMVAGGYKGALNEYRSYAKKFATEFEQNDDALRASFPQSHSPQALRLQRKVERATLGYELVPRSFVVALVSEFDAFLGRLLKAIFLRRPELLSGSDRTLGVAELFEFGTLEAARDCLLEKEIEAVIRKSHPDQFGWLENRFDLPLSKDLDAWKTFIELTERRNLFVHTDGVVSQQYLTVCHHHKADVHGDVAVGTRLAVSPQYFEQAHACVYEIGVKLGQVLWRKLLPDDIEAADSNLKDVTYDLLVNRWNALASKLLDFACKTLRKHSSDQSRRILVINRAQAYKWLDKQEKCEEIVTAEDWSACGEEFKLCVHVLRDEFKEARKVMRSIGKTGPVNEAAYEDWPLFRKFRDSEEFSPTFREVFGKEFTNIERTLKIDRQERMRELEEKLREAWTEEDPDDEEKICASDDAPN